VFVGKDSLVPGPRENWSYPVLSWYKGQSGVVIIGIGRLRALNREFAVCVLKRKIGTTL
jgi:hypothetical protein